MKIIRLGASLGAEISGLDLRSQLEPDVFTQLKQALLDNLVLVFRNQQLTPEQTVSFANQFGILTEHPVFPHLENYPPIIVIQNYGKQYSVNEHWHSDVTFAAQPPGETTLYALQMPEFGGDTQFSNQYLAYERLSDGMKIMLEGLNAHHTGAGTAKLAGKDISNAPSAIHPVIRTHPGTGKKALFVCRAFTDRFENMTIDESRPLLEWLFNHSAKYEYTMRHHWQVGDFVIWDNRCTLHYAIHDHGDAPRLLHRCTIEGETPV